MRSASHFVRFAAVKTTSVQALLRHPTHLSLPRSAPDHLLLMAVVLLLTQLLCPAPFFPEPVGKLLGLFLRGLVICCVQPSRKLADLLPLMGNVVFNTAEVSCQHLDPLQQKPSFWS